MTAGPSEAALVAREKRLAHFRPVWARGMHGVGGGDGGASSYVEVEYVSDDDAEDDL